MYDVLYVTKRVILSSDCYQRHGWSYRTIKVTSDSSCSMCFECIATTVIALDFGQTKTATDSSSDKDQSEQLIDSPQPQQTAPAPPQYDMYVLLCVYVCSKLFNLWEQNTYMYM